MGKYADLSAYKKTLHNKQQQKEKTKQKNNQRKKNPIAS